MIVPPRHFRGQWASLQKSPLVDTKKKIKISRSKADCWFRAVGGQCEAPRQDDTQGHSLTAAPGEQSSGKKSKKALKCAVTEESESPFCSGPAAEWPLTFRWCRLIFSNYDYYYYCWYYYYWLTAPTEQGRSWRYRERSRMLGHAPLDLKLLLDDIQS